MALPASPRSREERRSVPRLGRRHALGVLGLLPGALLAGCATGTATGVDVPAAAPGTPAPRPLRYGPDPAQYGVLHLPAGSAAALPVVVVIHGGFWQQSYGLELGTPLAVDLTNAGVAAWNVEYRRIGAGGGFPATFTDVATAVDTLAGPAQRAAGGHLDLSRVVLLGHSAGGHLAVWAASRSRLQLPAPGAGPAVTPRGTVAPAGVLDLVAAAAQGLGGGAVPDLLGGTPLDRAGRYALASPSALAPASGPVVCVHGTADTIVPIDQSRRYVAAALAARGVARLRALDGVDHFSVVDPEDPAWAAVREEVMALV